MPTLTNGHIPGVHTGFISLTTSLGYHYLLSDTVASSFTDASDQCVSQGSNLATLDNTKYQDVVDYLSANSPTYNSYQIWVDITKTSNPDRYYFSGGEEVDADKWFPGEPNENCYSNCCYRMTVTRSTYYGVGSHKLADHFCTQSYHFLCDDAVETTTTTLETTTTTPETTNTTPETTSTTPETTSTTPETTSTTPETTSTTPDTTSTTPETTSTTPETTSITSEITSTTPETTSTTPETTSTTPETTSTTPETTTPTTETTTAATSETSTLPSTATTSATSYYNSSNPTMTTAAPAPPSLPLSTGEQMSIIFIGIIVGGSLGISCCCASTWLLINRTRRRYNGKTADEENQEKEEESDDDSGVNSDEDMVS